MGRRKKIINNSSIPQHEIEKIARCIWPDILAFYQSEEGSGSLPSGNAKRRR